MAGVARACYSSPDVAGVSTSAVTPGGHSRAGPCQDSEKVKLLASQQVSLAPGRARVACNAPRRGVGGGGRGARRAPTGRPAGQRLRRAPADLGSVWKSLADPDFVILRGDEYRTLLGRSKGEGAAPVGPLRAAVVSVAVEGTVRGDLADLALDLDVNLAADGPDWVTVRLDGQTLKGATEGGKELPLRSVEAGGWQVELDGRGRHAVRVEWLSQVRATPEGRRLDLAVPEAPSTRLSVVIPQAVSAASTGPGEPVACIPLGGASPRNGPTRLAADLSPRGRIVLGWRADEPATKRLPPLLVAQGEIAVDIDAGSFRTRSSWSIRSLRGEARELVLKLDPDDEVLELELDGQAPPAGIERAGGVTRMTIPLAEPLGPNQQKLLVMTTRRAIPPGVATRVAFSGFPLTDAKEQTGSIGVVSTGNLWVTGSTGRGVREIDPRTQLPDELRSRPATEQAFRFSEQPFELSMRVEPSPPLVRVATRATVSLEPKAARVDTRFDFETSRGKLFDLSLGLPPGVEVESVGPPDVVVAWQIGVLPAPLTNTLSFGGVRLLNLRLGGKAREGSRFTVQVVSRQPLPAVAGELSVSLIQPIGAVPAGGRIGVWTDPGLTAELSERTRGAGTSTRFRPASVSLPADWPPPPGRPAGSPPMLWLRYDDGPPELPLLVASHPRALTETTSLTVRVDGREAEVQQDTECAVQFGSLTAVDLTVPAPLAGRWDYEGAARRSELGRTPGGDTLARLELPTEFSRPTRFRFRYRLPLPAPATPGAAVDLTVPWIRLDGAVASSPIRASVESAPALTVASTGSDWRPADDTEPTPGTLGVVLTSAGVPARPLRLNVTARALAELPRLVASRLLLRTSQGADGELRTTAGYRVEVHDAPFEVALPPGTVLQAVRVGGAAVGRYEPMPKEDGLRIAFPPSVGVAPVLVELDYAVPPDRTRGAWAAPRLLGGGVVQRTLLEVRVLWSRAVVGVPRAGWSDENEWHWEVYVWKRRPALKARALAAWVGAAGRPPAELDSGGDEHNYLFGRAGGPVGLGAFVASRASLVAVCSGLVLVAGGLLVLVWRPNVRLAWVAGAGSALAAATLVHPSVTYLAVQSAMVGVVLTALLAGMHLLVERRRPPAGVFAESNGRGAAPAPGSTMNHAAAAGSDDSTAIRVRAGSTLDYPPRVNPPPEGVPSPGSSRSEPLPRGGSAS